jgi:hypothetical protein
VTTVEAAVQIPLTAVQAVSVALAAKAAWVAMAELVATAAGVATARAVPVVAEAVAPSTPPCAM